MSSRALRRLQQQKQETTDGGDKDREDEEEEVIQVNSVKKKNKKSTKSGNIFDLLAAEDGETEITVADEEEVAIEDEKELKENGETPAVKVKTKKKRNKKKGKSSDKSNNNELDEIEQAVNQINGMCDGMPENGNDNIDSLRRISSEIPSPVFKRRSILLVDPRNLNTHNEMKRRFGANVVNADRRRDAHTRRFKRTTSLVTPKDNWPPFSKVGITMTQVKSENSTSCSYFMFEHQEIYRSVQFKFYDAVETMDHNNIIALLNAHPYHVDSMLQLSEICRINEDHRMAGELIERSLFVFECAFHTLFNITQGNCRLDYKRAENRPFFLALYRHISYIGDKACYRTALEFCKVLFGLDPVGDPLGVLFMLDYYAIKAEDYKYLIQVYDEYDVTRNLSLLPNFAFSYPLAKFLTGSLEEANELLRSALITFPSLLIELTEKVGVDIDNNIRTHPYFNPVTYLKQSVPLNQLIALYVGRCQTIWKQTEVLDWLVENAKYLTENLDKYEDEMTTAESRRNTCFRLSPQNVLRHILTSEIKEAVERLPIEVRSQSVMTHDPLPPDDSVIGYERPDRPGATGQDINMLSLFLQSLMPSYNQDAPNNPAPPPAGNELQAQAAAQPVGEDGAGNVADGARRLMDVMRDLLSTMTYRNDDQANNDDQEAENGDHDWDEE